MLRCWAMSMSRLALGLLLCGCGASGRAPSQISLHLSLPTLQTAVHDLEAELVAKGVNDPDTVRWSWTVDGALTDFDESTVPATALGAGQTWTATASAGRADRRKEVSASVTIDRLGGNVLVLLVDDLGIDKVGAYGVHDQAPPTPTIDSLADKGVLFRNMWVHPTCSPSRAALLTGRYPRRTGVGRWIAPGTTGTVLDPAVVVLPEMLALAPVIYEDSYVGKWHLSGFVDNPDAGTDPLVTGFSWYGGTLGNPTNSFGDEPDEPKGYYNWQKSTNGDMSFETAYLTTATTDDALARLGQMQEPWLMVVAYNAPHSPLHVPPAHLHGYDLDPETATNVERYDAAAQALDTEIARLLAGISPEVNDRTTLVFLSDNGTPGNVIREPLDSARSKGTVYEGGVNVPMIVTGPAVTQPGTETLALVESVDLFHTIADIAGVDLALVVDPRTGVPVQTDGISFLPHVRDAALPSSRDRAYTSHHVPNGPPPYSMLEDALRDERNKVVWHSDVGMSFFEYIGPFDEGPELLELGPLSGEQQEAYDRLSAELFERIEATTYGP